MKNAIDLSVDLSQFIGTEGYKRHWLGQMLYTDGVAYFAENAGNGAHWFLDIVATEVLPLTAKEDFIHIKMVVADSEAVIDADDGNDNLLWTRQIELTDCPEGKWRFYLEGNVLLLPSEH